MHASLPQNWTPVNLASSDQRTAPLCCFGSAASRSRPGGGRCCYPVTYMKKWPFVARFKIHGMRAFAETLPQHDPLQKTRAKAVVLDLDPMTPVLRFMLSHSPNPLSSPPHTQKLLSVLHVFLLGSKFTFCSRCLIVHRHAVLPLFRDWVFRRIFRSNGTPPSLVKLPSSFPLA